ncbi:MAG: radical SAM protein [Clostridia bacterium]|nr:radical SAM protein [Clostridia bacterium]MBQ2347932.1 radical SAM protein [Clostridia bacterium]MBQ5439541.1 radical SAM protein [Clostridia bacterium]
MGLSPKVARVGPHYWEEPCISGTKGSGAIFFSGCTLKCVFCQNYEISVNHVGTFITPEQLANCYRNLEDQGVHNINLVSASHFIEAVLESFKIYRPKIPVLYNSSGYETVESLKRLEGYIDIYLPDFKYSDNRLALKYSGAFDYTQTAIAAIKEMVRQTGKPVYDEHGIIQRGTIVRVLVLPNHTKDSLAILDTIRAYYGDKVLVSVMGQYVPSGEAYKYPEINRKITQEEYDEVVDHAIELDMDGFVQELSAADEEFIPSFDCSSSDYFSYQSST